MQYARGRAAEIRRILTGNNERCLNPYCQKPMKYRLYPNNKGYCCRECERAYTPTMLYFSRLYNKPLRELLVQLLNEHRYKKAVAEEMDVLPKTVARWIKRLGIRKEGKRWW